MPSSSSTDVPAALAAAVHEYRQQGDLGALLDRVKAVVRSAPADALAPAAAPFMDLPEVVIPVYERIGMLRFTIVWSMAFPPCGGRHARFGQNRSSGRLSRQCRPAAGR
jgi:hypothetical protein